MKMMLKDYVSDLEEKLNVQLMNKEADAPLVEFVMDSWKSLEVVPNIKITGFDYSDKESEIDINHYIFKREKKKKKKDRYDYKFIHDDRCGRLTVYIEVTLIEKNMETGEEFIHKYPMKKSMLIPLQDEDGYLYIKGKRYYMIYQMVEKSTYTSNSSVTLKSLMPIAVKRNIIEEDEALSNNITDETLELQGIQAFDVVGEHYVLPVYYIFVFRKEIPIILFYLSKGIDMALDYLGVSDIISFVPKIPDITDGSNIYFQLSNKCYLEVNRELFNKYTYVQSVVGGFLTVCTNRVKIESLDDRKAWIKKIANPNNYEKGRDILKFFNRLLDRTTTNILKINPYHKQNIYSLLRWIMQEYNELRMKDNLDLSNKRLRCNEYIASLLTKEFSRRLNRIISLGDKATIDTYKDLLKFPGDLLLQKMHSSGILRFDESVNDMSIFGNFKYTTKGPHSLGGKNSNNIGIKYRGLHPSYLGYIDCLVCGNSDPGTSGTLSLFSDIDGLYFNNDNEPESVAYQLSRDVERVCKEKGITYITLDFDSKDDFYNTLVAMQKFTDGIKIFMTSREGHYDILMEAEEEMDDSGSPSQEEKEAEANKKKTTKGRKKKVEEVTKSNTEKVQDFYNDLDN